MGIERVFLGWDRPGLGSAVAYLAARSALGDAIDLGEVIVAVPGGRVKRRLLELLVERAEESGRPLVPPRIVTVGRLPEMLYTPKRPFAGDLAQQLAWVASLRRSQADRIARLAPQLPAADETSGWLALGEMLSRLHQELAAEAMDFQSVVDCGATMKGFHEQERWETLLGLQRDYLATLDRLGLWDKQTARLFAVRQGECRAAGPIILVGTVDLNRLQRMMLEAVAEHVTAIVFAPESMAERFDELGCLRSDAWDALPVALDEEQIEVVDSAADQAAAVVRSIAALGGAYAADEITVGVPDERIVPYLLRQFRQCGLPGRHGVGEPLGRTSPYRLLAVVGEYLEQSSFVAFAAMARHPAVGEWLARRGVEGDWLGELDRYHAEHLPDRLDGRWLGGADKYGALRAAHQAVEELLRPLAGKPQSLAAWGPAVVELLLAVYGDAPLVADDPADRLVLAACERIHDELEEHRAIHAELMPGTSAAEAIGLVLRAVAGDSVPAPADRGAIELLGWLELPLDDAPVLVVTGMNEGIVPASLGADLFLPNQMRRALGLEDNERRLARDTYALAVLASSGRKLKLIAGRRSPEGDPLMPSRLLLLADAETTARRVRRLFGESGALGTTGCLGQSGAMAQDAASLGHHFVMAQAPQAQPALPIPAPVGPFEPVESMRVTEFRDYLACPYRYYLRHRLGLERLEDRAEELAGNAFGSLAHDLLGEFGRSDVARSTRADEIAAMLDETLTRQAGRVYGGKPLASVRVQVEQLRLRLRRFAEWQARHAVEGWRIEHVEWTPPEQVALDVDGRPMGLRGRIDRIDVHEASGERMILDYKTSDKVDPPHKSHRDKSGWVDLQMPLYRHLARGLGIDDSVALAYIALPKDPSKVDLLMKAEWSEADLEDADETARQVVRDIRAGKFWPPVDPPPKYFEEFSAICQDDQFGAASAGENGDEEESAA